MAVHLLLFNGREAPPNDWLDGVIVVVQEVAFQVVVTIPARQIAVPVNNSSAAVIEDFPRPLALVDEVDHEIAVVTEVLKPIAVHLLPEIPVAKVDELPSGLETR